MGPCKDTHGTLGPGQREGRGWPEQQFSTANSADTSQTWRRNVSNKSLVCKSLSSHDRETDVAEETMSAMVKLEKDGYVYEEPQSVKDGARGTEERALT